MEHHAVTHNSMFQYASAFDQDLGWCVDDDVELYYAFWSTVQVDVLRRRSGCRWLRAIAAPDVSADRPAPRRPTAIPTLLLACGREAARRPTVTSETG